METAVKERFILWAREFFKTEVSKLTKNNYELVEVPPPGITSIAGTKIKIAFESIEFNEFVFGNFICGPGFDPKDKFLACIAHEAMHAIYPELNQEGRWDDLSIEISTWEKVAEIFPRFARIAKKFIAHIGGGA